MAKYANEFDDFSESMLDGVMCTPTCPCFGDETQKSHLNPRGEEKSDAFTFYANLDEEKPKYLEAFDRHLINKQSKNPFSKRGDGSD